MNQLRINLGRISKKHWLLCRKRNSNMEQMFITGYRNSWNQRFYKRRGKVLQHDGEGHIKSSRRMVHKGWIHVCPFFWHGSHGENQMENGLSKIFYVRVQTIDVSDQAIFTLNYSGIHNEEWKKINKSKSLTSTQRWWDHFMSFMMMVHQYQADPNFNQSCMNCRACFQLPL